MKTSNSGLRVKYGNFAPDAKENFLPKEEETSKTAFNTLNQLPELGLFFPKYANPCELYQTVLDGSQVAFPSDTTENAVGFWSEQISNKKGEFANPIVLTMEADGQFSSQGILLTFDDKNDIHSKNVSIKWYKDDSLLSEMDFQPTSAKYFCNNQVENYDKLVITFYDVNMPFNRLKLFSIDHGYEKWFENGDFKSMKIIQEINPISSEISINTADFSLSVDKGFNPLFQKKQSLSIYFNGELKALTFIKSFKRKSKKDWDFQTEDYIGLLDSVPYYGGVYFNKNALEIINDISAVSKVPFEVEDSFLDKTVTGYIPYTSCREALMQVAFAIQAVVDTSNSEKVKIFALKKDISQEIPLRRILTGQNFQDEDIVTAVELTEHEYLPIEEDEELYNANNNGDGNDIFIKFNDPHHDIKIGKIEKVDDKDVFVESTEVGKIISSGANYAVIDAQENCVLMGKKYKHSTKTKRKNNNLVLKGDVEKVVSIESATLVSRENSDSILENSYQNLVKTDSVNMRIVEGKHYYFVGSRYGTIKYGEAKYGTKVQKMEKDQPVNVGDKILAKTEYMGDIEGTILRQSFNLNGGIIIKDCIVK